MSKLVLPGALFTILEKFESMTFSDWGRIMHLQNASKLTEKQMDKVRRIVNPKLTPFQFQVKTYYLSDANYPTDNPSLV